MWTGEDDDDVPNLHVVHENSGARFYIVHGTIHDRKTGKHVTSVSSREKDPMAMTVTETCEMLNKFDNQAEVADYVKTLADHDRNVRRLDVALNGEAGAAKQASLCDVVGQVEDLRRKNDGRPLLVAPPFKQVHVVVELTSDGCNYKRVFAVSFDKADARRSAAVLGHLSRIVSVEFLD